jgi:hypothetical protein
MTARRRKSRRGAPTAVFTPVEIRLIGAAIVAAALAAAAASMIAGRVEGEALSANGLVPAAQAPAAG